MFESTGLASTFPESDCRPPVQPNEAGPLGALLPVALTVAIAAAAASKPTAIVSGAKRRNIVVLFLSPFTYVTLLVVRARGVAERPTYLIRSTSFDAVTRLVGEWGGRVFRNVA